MLQFIVGDSNPGSGTFLTRDPGCKKSRSGINIQDPKHWLSPSLIPACLWKRCGSGFIEYGSGFFFVSLQLSRENCHLFKTLNLMFSFSPDKFGFPGSGFSFRIRITDPANS